MLKILVKKELKRVFSDRRLVFFLPLFYQQLVFIYSIV